MLLSGLIYLENILFRIEYLVIDVLKLNIVENIVCGSQNSREIWIETHVCKFSSPFHYFNIIPVDAI